MAGLLGISLDFGPTRLPGPSPGPLGFFFGLSGLPSGLLATGSPTGMHVEPSVDASNSGVGSKWEKSFDVLSSQEPSNLIITLVQSASQLLL